MNVTKRIRLVTQYRIILILFIFLAFFLAIIIPSVDIRGSKIDLGSEANATMVNGILTASAIVFGFVAFEIREIKAGYIEKIVLVSPMLLFLMATVRSYFDDAMLVGYATKMTMLLATSDFLFNLFYFFIALGSKVSHLEIEAKAKSEVSA